MLQFGLQFTAPEQNYIAKDQIVWNDVYRCRTAAEQNHCSGVKFRNDVPDFIIAVGVADTIALHCNAQNAPEQNFGVTSIDSSFLKGALSRDSNGM